MAAIPVPSLPIEPLSPFVSLLAFLNPVFNAAVFAVTEIEKPPILGIITPLRKTLESSLQCLHLIDGSAACIPAGNRPSLPLALCSAYCSPSSPRSLPPDPSHRPTDQSAGTSENAQTHDMRLCVLQRRLNNQAREKRRNTSHALQGLGLPLKLIQLLICYTVEFLCRLKYSIKCPH